VEEGQGAGTETETKAGEANGAEVGVGAEAGTKTGEASGAEAAVEAGGGADGAEVRVGVGGTDGAGAGAEVVIETATGKGKGKGKGTGTGTKTRRRGREKKKAERTPAETARRDEGQKRAAALQWGRKAIDCFPGTFLTGKYAKKKKQKATFWRELSFFFLGGRSKAGKSYIGQKTVSK